MGDTTDLHENLGWSKTNENFGGILEALVRGHQGDTIGAGNTNGPPDATTVTASSFVVGSDPDGGWGVTRKEGEEDVGGAR